MQKTCNRLPDCIIISILGGILAFYKALIRSLTVWGVLKLVCSVSLPFGILFIVLFILDFIGSYFKVKSLYV